MALDIKIIHKSCGTQIGWWAGNIPKPGGRVRADDFVRMDESKADMASRVVDFCPECPGCGKPVRNITDMERVE